jgi:hypothetical protein
MRRHPVDWAIVSALLVSVGGVAPWATMLGFSMSGSHGDGRLLIVGGAVAAGLLAWKRAEARWPAVVSAVIGVAGLVVAGQDLSDLAQFSSARPDIAWAGFEIEVGWGLYLSLAASALLVLTSLATAARARPAPAVELR